MRIPTQRAEQENENENATACQQLNQTNRAIFSKN